jgi:hypothetical protein
MGNPVLAQHRADYTARQFIEQHRRQHLAEFFEGTRLVTKKLALAEAIGSVKYTTRSLKSSTGAAVGATASAATAPAKAEVENLVLEMICQIFDVSNIVEVVQELTQNVVTEVVGAFVPLAGTAVTGTRAIYYWGNTALAAHSYYKSKERASDVLPGDPAAAVHALLRMIRREINENAIKAGRLTARGAVQLGTDALTIAGIAGSPAFGGGVAVTALAQAANAGAAAVNCAVALVHQLYLMARDMKEKRKANKMLGRRPVDANLFQVCPLLGCYYLANSSTSDIVHVLASDFGAPGWMDRVEKQHKHSINELQKSATEAIKSHRYELEGLKATHGMYYRGDKLGKAKRWWDRTTNKAKFWT